MLGKPEQFKQPEKSDVEQKKNNVIDVLKRNQNFISGFNLTTNSANGSGFWDTSEKKENSHVQYDSRYKNDFVIVPLKGSEPVDIAIESVRSERPYYIFDKASNRLTFEIPLGRGFGDTRPGNIYRVTLKFKNEDVSDKTEILTKISELFKSLNIYYSNNPSDAPNDRYQIAKQGIPVLEAFNEISKNYQDGNLSIDQIIEEYKMTIKEYEKTT